MSDRDEARPGRTGRRRTTSALVVVIVLLLLLGAGEIAYLVRDPAPAVSAARPVVTGEVTRRAVANVAAGSTEEILSTDYRDYDQQVDRAAQQMTSAFARDYRSTADRIRTPFIAHRTRLQVQAVARGVVRASSSQAQVLLFLDQSVEKVQDGRRGTGFARYPALVTVVRTDRGWLVSDIRTP
jgi:Mce-associated membrane protein